MYARVLAVALALVSCKATDGASATSSAPDPQAAGAARPAEPAPKPVARSDAEPDPELESEAEPTPEPAPRPEGHDFIDEAQAIFRVAACGGDGPVPERLDTPALARHCKKMARRIASYEKHWADIAGPFIADLRPDDVPGSVVYPFGGGDLVSALVVFPDAREITTISLEAAGDVRAIDTLGRRDVREELDVIRHEIHRLFLAAHSTTKSLQTASHSRLPGTVVFALTALAVHGHEPVSLRYFDIEPDGSLRYLDVDELDARQRESERGAARQKTRKSRQVWREQHAAFANVEIEFRSADGGDVRTYRHIVANLDDYHMTDDDRVLQHLAAKGDIAAMTKAASYLLWLPEFSRVRDYLLDNVVWMLSDSSGLPPKAARKAGFEQIPYGTFTGPYFVRDPERVRKQMVALWESSPARPLPFRFGYPDAEKKPHMLVTRRAEE